MREKPGLTPCLWMDSNAEDAMNFYLSVFEDSRPINVSKGPDGKVMIATVEVRGQTFTLLNGGPMFPQSEAFSFMVDCADQTEVDYLWDTLTADGGKPSRCGWLKDKFGISWQIIPRRFYELMSSHDPAARARVFQAVMKMDKFIIADLEAAAKA